MYILYVRKCGSLVHSEKREDTKEVIRRLISKKDRQQNDQTKKNEKTNNDLQNTTQKNKDRATRTPLYIYTKTGSELRTKNVSD